jgi:hypothetical protein
LSFRRNGSRGEFCLEKLRRARIFKGYCAAHALRTKETTWMKTRHGIVAVALMGLPIACGGSSGGPAAPTPSTSGTGTLTAPTAETPKDDAQLDTLHPTLTVRNGASTGSGPRTYEFQISDRSDFTTSVTSYVPGLASS